MRYSHSRFQTLPARGSVKCSPFSLSRLGLSRRTDNIVLASMLHYKMSELQAFRQKLSLLRLKPFVTPSLLPFDAPRSSAELPPANSYSNGFHRTRYGPPPDPSIKKPKEPQGAFKCRLPHSSTNHLLRTAGRRHSRATDSALSGELWRRVSTSMSGCIPVFGRAEGSQA